MEGILAKTGNDYILYSKDNNVLGITSGTIEGRKLSLHNCEDIERGYDLMKLAEENSHKYYDVKTTDWHCNYNGFFSGFQKALEILGNKKFSEDDLRLAMHFGKFGETNNQTTTIGFIKSLQQTEWDVEVEQELIQSSIQGEAIWELKLDADGCLILRRI